MGVMRVQEAEEAWLLASSGTLMLFPSSLHGLREFHVRLEQLIDYAGNVRPLTTSNPLDKALDV